MADVVHISDYNPYSKEMTMTTENKPRTRTVTSALFLLMREGEAARMGLPHPEKYDKVIRGAQKIKKPDQRTRYLKDEFKMLVAT
jgi:hypothetical protein